MMDAGWKNALSLSLRQDLQQIKIMTREMGLLVKRHQEVHSWLFPNRPYSSTLDMDAGTYTQCLESVLDGVYIVLNMLIVYINDSAPLTAGRKPRRLTLGQSFEVLWLKVREFVSSGRKRRPGSPVGVSTNIKLCSVEKSSQTEDKTSPGCDSCFVSVSCIKKVVNALDEYADSNTKLARKNVRTHLFETTLFGSMIQMSASVVKDVENLIANNKQLTSEIAIVTTRNTALKHDYKEMKKTTVEKEKYDNLELEYEKQCSRCSKLNKDLLKVKYDNEKLSAGLVEFVRRQERFVGDLEGFTNGADKVQNVIMLKLQMNDNALNRIRYLLESYRIQQLRAAKEENKTLIRNISNCQFGVRAAFENCLFRIENFQISITQKLQDKSEAIRRIEETAKMMGTADLKRKYEKLCSAYRKEREKRCKLEMKYVKSAEENKRLACASIPNAEIAKVKQLAASVLQKLNETEESVLCTLDARLNSIKRIEISIRRYIGISTVAVKGNPIEDMTRQIEANEAKMSVLKRENCNLLRTVNKLKLMNLPGVVK